jgi:hypothetical protein
MPLTRERIEELRRGTGSCAGTAEMTELLDAALAWDLLLHACRSCSPQERLKYGWRVTYNGDLLAHVQCSEVSPTPQAAVLAALRTKGE